MTERVIPEGAILYVVKHHPIRWGMHGFDAFVVRERDTFYAVVREVPWLTFDEDVQVVVKKPTHRALSWVESSACDSPLIAGLDLDFFLRWLARGLEGIGDVITEWACAWELGSVWASYLADRRARGKYALDMASALSDLCARLLCGHGTVIEGGS